MAELRIGGLARLSTCDWPGELTATVFCQGCPWRCPYCHNPHLLAARGPEVLPWPEVLTFLRSRQGLLDGVVFSGGEPTAQRALPEAVRTVRALGFRIGLHTGGPAPGRLAAVLPWVDWVGFDVKAAFTDYDAITRTPGSGGKARQSLALLIDSGVPFQARTTVHPALLDDDALIRLSADLDAMGVSGHVVQPFRPTGCDNPDLRSAALA